MTNGKCYEASSHGQLPFVAEQAKSLDLPNARSYLFQKSPSHGHGRSPLRSTTSTPSSSSSSSSAPQPPTTQLPPVQPFAFMTAMWNQVLPAYASVSRSIQNRLPRKWSKSLRSDELPTTFPIQSCPSITPAPLVEQPVKDIVMEDCTLPSAAFSALPVDILRKVFLFVGPNVLSKIALTHVCKHWRTTALEFPLMWTHLDLDYLSGLATVAMVLQRSKGLPLSLHCSIWTALRHSVCVSEIRRTCEVDFSIDSYSQLTVRHFLENTSAPVLIRCSLEFSTYEIQAPSIFKKQHPLLRDLSLTSCRMAYTAGNYFGLRRLEIRCTVEPDLTYPEDECLVELFKWSPDLEEVVLHSCAVHPQLTKAYVGDGRRTNITHLPKLRLMDLRLRTSNIHAIASSIRPSSDLSLNIVASICPATPEDEQILSEHSPLMAAALNRAQAIVLDGRALTMAAFMDVDLRNESMRVQLDYPHPLNFYNVLLKPTITSDMLPNLRRLRFRHTSAEDVVTILRSLPSVTTLELCVDESEGFSCRDILSVLEAEIRSGTSLCQALQTLSFDDARLDSISRATLVQLRALLPNLRRLALYRCEVEVGLEATLGALSTFDVVEWSEHEISSS